MITLQQLEETIGPAHGWAGRCYATACAAASMIEGAHAVYGHFLGKVEPSSIFYGRCPVVQHGWVLLPDGGGILDPTRWEFEGKDPYLFTSKEAGDEYDEGGRQLRARRHGDPPAFDPDADMLLLNDDVLPSSDAWSFVERVLKLDENYEEGCSPGDVTVPQLFWLGNLDPDVMEGHALAVYAAIDALGLGGFVPIDNRTRAERDG